MAKFFLYLKEWIWDLFVNGIISSYLVHFKVRNIFYYIAGIKKISVKKSAIHARCYISGKNIEIKEGSYINKECLLDAKGGNITIGKNVGIGYRCQLLTTNHSYTDKKKRTGKVIASDITIGDGCWIGAGSIINPGVTIGDGCVIASGSVVTRDCISNGLYAGVPAKMIKRLEQGNSVQLEQYCR